MSLLPLKPAELRSGNRGQAWIREPHNNDETNNNNKDNDSDDDEEDIIGKEEKYIFTCIHKQKTS